jgi:hypothetical protein
MVVVAATAVLGIAGCSSSTGGGGKGTGPASTPPASTPATSAAPVSSPAVSASAPASSGAASGGVLSQQAAQGALIVATDVGTGFAQATSDDSSDPLPCTPNDPPLDTQVPASTKAQVDFGNAAGSALVSEEITSYADEATAVKALAGGEKGFACKTATIGTGGNKMAFTLAGPTDLTTQVSTKVDKCEGWQLKSKTVNLVVIVSRIGQQIAALTFTASASIDPATLPSSQAVTEAALKKVAAAL